MRKQSSISILNKYWNNIRMFAFYNRTLFEMIFLVLYTAEQALLIYIASKELLNSVTVSYFVLLVLTTFAIHKIFMESRIRILDEEIKQLNTEKDSIRLESRKVRDKYKKLLEYKASNRHEQ